MKEDETSMQERELHHMSLTMICTAKAFPDQSLIPGRVAAAVRKTEYYKNTQDTEDTEIEGDYHRDGI